MPGFDIALEKVVKDYDAGRGTLVRALDGVDLAVAAGATVAVAGPSGSGKSTLLHVVGAMDGADSGSVRVGPHDLATLRGTALADYRRGIGFVFQRFHLLPALTALDNVIAPVAPVRTGFDKKARARELLAAVGLADRAGHVPGQLSGGQQQRVAIARALINSPGVVLADEPTGALDSRTGVQIVDLLLRMRDEHGFTLLVATHDTAVAGRMDRRVTLVDGLLTDDTGVSSQGPEMAGDGAAGAAPEPGSNG